ncbi:Fanconi anemia group J protein homolog [Venturia canescens]|uniref:Fanconi anemia group J protein homolog n=1 Tax=Venturia canescens TaxID=32260 RepID=UPI001C9D5D77|nr:Fanconi anemia group J protein homolog [Venturia canescens]
MSFNKAVPIVYLTSDDDSSCDDEFGKNKRSQDAKDNVPLADRLSKEKKFSDKNVPFSKDCTPVTYLTSDEDSSFEEFASGKRSRVSQDDKPLSKRMAANKKSLRGGGASSKTSDKDSLADNDFNRRQRDNWHGVQDIRDSEEPEEPQVKIQHQFEIEGIKVEMPVKPYPCQKAVISAIIKGCQTEQHCLLESPTGSGKTLALLCGALAWQTDFAKAMEQKAKQKDVGRGPTTDSRASCKESCAEEAASWQANDDFDLDGLDWSDDSFGEECMKKVPTIYYGSRTHKQIEQVVKELRKTSYATKKMTILSSREHTCIQESDRDKTSLCNDLLDPKKKFGCPYYTENNKQTLGTNYALHAHGIESPWDIEDLVEAGREAKACPYFAARSLMAEADIVFCPYNYIIDPVIRENMQIDLKGSIVILDEAHNIENICRDCGSAILSTEELEKIIKECETIIQIATINKDTNQIGYVSVISQFVQNLLRFVNTTQLKPQIKSDSLHSDMWTGNDFIQVLEITKSITSHQINNFTSAALQATLAHNTAKELMRTGKPIPLTLHHDVLRSVEKMSMAFKMVSDPQYRNDYRVVIRQVPQGYKIEKSVEFMCMNPGVIFTPISYLTRTSVLASGTLAPTSSYQGELGVKFAFTIQADHVTPPEQVFIKCISKGPAGKSLRATYQNVNTWDFQDDLGALLLITCEAMPHGILMFFSSYTTMGTLVNRWKKNGTWNKLARIKTIFQETRGSADLSTMMENYREVIRTTSNGPVGTVTGALLLAVFRGKVAEGIDFSDNEARCVLTVGIPYSVRNDPATDMKFQYNDQNRQKGLLSGNEWYTIQAFRALNQALGRAIRHQNDWGAIILIDERFCEPRNVNLLPTWVRTMWMKQSEVNTDLRQLLKCFVAKQIKRERGKLRMTQSSA